MVTCSTYIFDIMKVQHIFPLSPTTRPRILWLNVVFCSKNSRLTCISFSCECLVDITSCILAADESKLDPDHTISPLKEPLKKKGNDITNPYPNFKVCSPHNWNRMFTSNFDFYILHMIDTFLPMPPNTKKVQFWLIIMVWLNFSTL